MAAVTSATGERPRNLRARRYSGGGDRHTQPMPMAPDCRYPLAPNVPCPPAWPCLFEPTGPPMTPFAPVRIQRLPLGALALATCALLLQACGGGGSSSTLPSVSAATADRLSYGRSSTFTVTGTNLSTAVSYAATGCDGLTLLAGGSATQQQFTCTPNQTLSVGVAASTASGEIYRTTAQAVPKPQVTLTTSLGNVIIELEPAVVKVTVDNFLSYVKAGFYNGTIFHRVIPGFMVQGGGFTAVAGSTLTPQTGLRAAIALESNKGLSNLRGTIAMARTSVADSATSQFFLNSVNNGFLDYAKATSSAAEVPGYAVFGHIVTGLGVIDTISAVATRTVGGSADVPVTDIVVQTAAQTL